MHIFVEIWTPRQSWLDLSPADRQAYVEMLGPLMQKHEEMGIETVAMANIDTDTDAKVRHHYFSVLRMPDEATAKTFEADIRAAGWYEYFDQQNARGKVREAKDVIGEHIAM